MKKVKDDELESFVSIAERLKMRELWDNEEDEAWDDINNNES